MEESSNGNVKEVNDKVFDREVMVDENSDVVVKKLTGDADMNNSSSSSSSSDDEEIDEQNNPASVEEVEERILLPVLEETVDEEQILIPVLEETVEEVEPEFEKLELPDVPQSDSKEKDVGHSDTLVKETKDLLIRNLQENDGIAVSTGGTEEAESGENEEENAKTLDDKSWHIGSSKFGEPSSNTVDDLSYSAATEHGNHPQVPPNPPLISLRQHHTSWLSCCGMLGLLRRSNS